MAFKTPDNTMKRILITLTALCLLAGCDTEQDRNRRRLEHHRLELELQRQIQELNLEYEKKAAARRAETTATVEESPTKVEQVDSYGKKPGEVCSSPSCPLTKYTVVEGENRIGKKRYIAGRLFGFSPVTSAVLSQKKDKERIPQEHTH
jgi:hypothetical protein